MTPELRPSYADSVTATSWTPWAKSMGGKPLLPSAHTRKARTHDYMMRGESDDLGARRVYVGFELFLSMSNK